MHALLIHLQCVLFVVQAYASDSVHIGHNVHIGAAIYPLSISFMRR